MEIWNEILGNQVLVCSVAGWTVAQVLKTIIDVVLNRSFNPERLFGSGGMPSSHSATVCALTTASGLKYGVGSFEFAISFVVAMVVMYDAMGVRRPCSWRPLPDAVWMLVQMLSSAMVLMSFGGSRSIRGNPFFTAWGISCLKRRPWISSLMMRI